MLQNNDDLKKYYTWGLPILQLMAILALVGIILAVI